MPLSDKEKESIIDQALGTPEGRMALAQAMVAPISAAILETNLANKLLFEEEKEYDINRYEDVHSNTEDRFDILDL